MIKVRNDLNDSENKKPVIHSTALEPPPRKPKKSYPFVLFITPDTFIEIPPPLNQSKQLNNSS